MNKHTKQQLAALGTATLGAVVATQIDIKLLSGLILIFTGVIITGIFAKEV